MIPFIFGIAVGSIATITVVAIIFLNDITKERRRKDE